MSTTNTRPTGSAEAPAGAEEPLPAAALAHPRIWARMLTSSPAYMGGVLLGQKNTDYFV